MTELLRNLEYQLSINATEKGEWKRPFIGFINHVAFSGVMETHELS